VGIDNTQRMNNTQSMKTSSAPFKQQTRTGSSPPSTASSTTVAKHGKNHAKTKEVRPTSHEEQH